jgi:hypothetical protein
MSQVQILRFAIRTPDADRSNGTTNCQVSVSRAGSFAKRDERDNRLFRQDAARPKRRDVIRAVRLAWVVLLDTINIEHSLIQYIQ